MEGCQKVAAKSGPEIELKVRFNRPYMTSREIGHIRHAHREGRLGADGPFTAECERWLEERLGCGKAILVHSATAALEMAAILADIRPGDEVIMPSFTFVSTANAFVLRGGVPVFVDIRPDTLNLDETRIAAAVTRRTKAIVPVHYAGTPCEMDPILSLARRKKLFVIEDAAQSIFSKHNGKYAGTLGQMAALSFHETKNIISGEGGALLLNDRRLFERADIVAQKGTDRKRFLRGEVDKYTWRDIGSSYKPSELVSAFLWGQFENSESIQKKRMALWNIYEDYFSNCAFRDEVVFPKRILNMEGNGHIFYLLLRDAKTQKRFLEYMLREGIGAVFHYAPLHRSAAGRKYGRSIRLPVTDNIAARLVRLPLWANMRLSDVEQVCSSVKKFFK